MKEDRENERGDWRLCGWRNDNSEKVNFMLSMHVAPLCAPVWCLVVAGRLVYRIPNCLVTILPCWELLLRCAVLLTNWKASQPVVVWTTIFPPPRNIVPPSIERVGSSISSWHIMHLAHPPHPSLPPIPNPLDGADGWYSSCLSSLTCSPLSSHAISLHLETSLTTITGYFRASPDISIPNSCIFTYLEGKGAFPLKLPGHASLYSGEVAISSSGRTFCTHQYVLAAWWLEIMMVNDGTMARCPELRQMAGANTRTETISIHDLIVYRPWNKRKESIVEKVSKYAYYRTWKVPSDSFHLIQSISWSTWLLYI